MAKEYGSRGICINAVCPGFIHGTDMFSASFPSSRSEENDGVNAISPQQQLLLNSIPLKRFGTCDEVAGLVRFLALDSAAAYMTGHCINIDGGVAIGAT